jgi:hypothetical protein
MKTEKENLRIVAFALAMSVLVACTGSETGTPREASGTAPKGAQSENVVPQPVTNGISGIFKRARAECSGKPDSVSCLCSAVGRPVRGTFPNGQKFVCP